VRAITPCYTPPGEEGSLIVDHVDRFGVSMDPELLAAFDRLRRRRGYKSRSKAIRDIIRHALVEEE
jgi:metal-responsive CopG/Arc/MetJ family transcriptional regulator